MLDIKLLRQSIEAVAKQLEKRGQIIDIDTFLKLEEKRKSLQTTLQTLQAERNKRSKEIGQAKAQNQTLEETLTAQLKMLNQSLKTTEEQFTTVEQQLNDFLATLPNLPHDSVPVGSSEAEKILKRLPY